MRAQKDEVKREQSVKERDACIEHCVIFCNNYRNWKGTEKNAKEKLDRETAN